MTTIFNNYTHLKCDNTNCNGHVRTSARNDDPPNMSGYICHKCGKSISWSYVAPRYDVFMLNDKTGWVFPMVRKINKELNND